LHDSAAEHHVAKKTGGRLFWLLAGAALGAAARILWERRHGGRLADPMHRVMRPDVSRPLSPTGRVARLARQALRADPALAALGIRVVPVSAGTVELRGWVATRALRSQALRAVRSAPTVERVVNHILVHGEDDLDVPSSDEHSEQSA
jgi:hypothetical protein